MKMIIQNLPMHKYTKMASLLGGIHCHGFHLRRALRPALYYTYAWVICGEYRRVAADAQPPEVTQTYGNTRYDAHRPDGTPNTEWFLM